MQNNTKAPSTGNTRYQLALSPPPRTLMAKRIINGPQNDDTALTTCPAVTADVSLPSARPSA